jgi:hypothetical protein
MMIANICEYIQIPNREAEECVKKLIGLIRETRCAHYAITERSEGSTKYVDIKVSVKVTASTRP